METAVSICLGIGLSAACGFRVFVPLLVLSLASHAGLLHLAQGFEWVGTPPAMIAFSVATGVEIVGYYIPWVDHLLDTLASPAAVLAGVLASVSLATDLSPFARWTLAVIAGGGAAGIVQGTTVLTRGLSTATTGGLGNFVVATLELVMSVVVSLLSLAAPVLVMLLLVLFVALVARKVWKRRRASSMHPEPPSPPGEERVGKRRTPYSQAKTS
jgi:hypothetical protein